MAAHFIDPLNVLPTNAVGTHRVGRWLRGLAGGRQQGRSNFISVCRFGQIVYGSRFHRRDRRGYIAITGQHDDPRVGSGVAHGFNDLETGAVFQAQIKNCKGRRRRPHGTQCLSDTSSHGCQKSTLFQGATQPRSQRDIIIKH